MDQIEDLKKEIVSLKIRIRRLEEFVSAIPNSDDYVHVSEEPDGLFEQAVEIIKSHDLASASLLQRRLSIGYSRAARLMDELEEKGYVGKAEGAKPRKVIKNN